MTWADVHASAGRIREAADAVRTTAHAAHAGDVAAALPGSTSAGAASRVESRWAAAVVGWASAAGSQAERMSGSADDTEGRDAAVGGSLQRLASRLGPTPR